MKTYQINETEFTAKDFRQAGNRKTYYIQFSEVANSVFKTWGVDIYGFIATKVYTDNDETVKFDTFLQSFIDGDFEKIKELQVTIDGQDELMELAVKVITDFLALKRNGKEN